MTFKITPLGLLFTNKIYAQGHENKREALNMNISPLVLYPLTDWLNDIPMKVNVSTFLQKKCTV